MKFDEIVIALRKTIQENYSETENEENGILIISRTLRSRVVSNWGRDEDTDENIYLNKSGWLSVTTVQEYGAGPAKVISENKKEVNDEYIYNILNGDRDITLYEFLSFIDRFYKTKEKYGNKFNNNLY